MVEARLYQRAIAYEPTFDQKEGLKVSYLSKQIDTFIGERLNVLLSKNKYEIKNNLIYGQDMDDSFVAVMKRGIRYRESVEGENRVDKKREEAELEGFLKTQEILCNPETSVGTMILSISPQGEKKSLYQHNFYDIFTLKEENGKKFIEARRYSSALLVYEYKDKLSPLSFMKNILTDADFLSHPIKIDDVFFENADRLHSYLHKDHKTTEVEEFKRIKKTYERLKQEYYRERSSRILSAIMNKADIEAGFVEGKPDRFYDAIIGPSIPLRIDQEIYHYGNMSVREVATGCGSSSNILEDLDKYTPFSVLSFGLDGDEIDYEFDQDGPCKNCKAINVRCGPCGICRPCDLDIRSREKGLGGISNPRRAELIAV